MGSLMKTFNAARGITATLVREALVGSGHVARSVTETGHTPLLRAPGSDSSRPPVMLVHGLCSTSGYWSPLVAVLLSHGYDVMAVNYRWTGTRIVDCGDQVADAARMLVEQTGHGRIHVVGHSLGGVVTKWATHHTSLGSTLASVVTLASPHRGSPIAVRQGRYVPFIGPLLEELRPGHPSLTSQSVPLPAGLSWSTVAGGGDLLVPGGAARLPDSARCRGSVGGHEVVPKLGHLGMVSDALVMNRVVGLLDAVTRHPYAA